MRADLRSVVTIFGFLALSTAFPAAAAPVRVTSPAAARCTAPGLVLAFAPGASSIDRDPAATPRLTCDGAGLEPRDIAGDEASISLFPARTAVLRFTEPTAFELDWIAVEGDVPRVLATRSFEPSKEIAIPVANDEPRWLRVRRGKSSPVTLRVAAGDRPTLEIPKPTAGGEIFGRLPDREFMPKQIATFPDTRSALTEDRFFALHGLPPRSYALRAIYQGGIDQHVSERAVVKAGESTWIDLNRMQPVGSVIASLSLDLCRDGGTIVILSGDDVLSERPVARDACSLTWEGVPPGLQTVRFRRAQEGVIASEEIDVAADRAAFVTLTRNTPVVRGRVLVGDEPAADARIRFSRASDRVDVVAEFDGRYEARLPHTGIWTIGSLMTEYGAVAVDTHEFVAGEQEFDLVLPAGRLRITVASSEDEGRFAQLYIRGPKGSTAPVPIGKETDVRGLPLGSYTVEARAEGVGSSDPVTIELTREKPTGDVTLELEGGDVVVALLGADGKTPSDGMVAVAGGPTFREFAPGRFRLTAVRDGQSIRIRAAGYEPACAVARAPQTTVTLRPVGSQPARFRTARTEFGFSVRGFLGSDCWITHHDLKWQYVPGGFEISNLNPGSYTISVEGRRTDFVVPGPVIDLDAR